MSKLITYINTAYPSFVDYADKHTIYETQKKYAHILPIIQADVMAYAKENNIDLNLIDFE